MLFVESTLMGYAVEASDGKIGAVRDFLLTIRAGRSGGWSSMRGAGCHGGKFCSIRRCLGRRTPCGNRLP